MARLVGTNREDRGRDLRDATHGQLGITYGEAAMVQRYRRLRYPFGQCSAREWRWRCTKRTGHVGAHRHRP